MVAARRGQQTRSHDDDHQTSQGAGGRHGPDSRRPRRGVAPPVGASTSLRPWVVDPRLNPYQLVSGRAPAAPGEVAVTRHAARAGRLGVGDELRVLLPKRTWDVRVALTQTEAKLVAPAPRQADEGEAPEPVYLAVVGADATGRPGVLHLQGGLPPLRPGEIGLSSSVMAQYHLRAGQPVTLRGAAGRVTLRIAGGFRDPSHLFADEALVEPTTMARLDPDARTTAVLVGGTASTATLSRAVAGVPGAKVYDRAGYVRHAADDLLQGMRLIYGFLGMSLLIALFGMATTVSLSVADRTREFGLLAAIGTTGRQLRSIVRWEAATVIALGTLLGMAAAVTTVALLHLATGSSFLRVELPWWLIGMVTAGAAVVALLTSTLPARRAAAVPVLEATRAE